MAKADFRFHTPLRVRWWECDPQGIVYFGAYMNYLEVGQSEYFRHLGFSVYRVAQRGYFDTAVVKTAAEYKAPARLDDVLDLCVRVSSIGNTSLSLDMEIYPQDGDQLLTVVQAVYVGYDARSGSTRRVPDDVRDLVKHFEATGEVLPLAGFPRLAEAAR
jgi:acyl-CoA thioester hydrolase